MWEKVIKKLRTGAMPPLGMPQAGSSKSGCFCGFCLRHRSIGRRRSNPIRADPRCIGSTGPSMRTRSAIFSPSISIATEFLPADDSSFGFDNVASVLGLSPALQERYVSAAGKISRLAVGDPAIGAIVATYRVRSDISQDDHIEGLPLGTRGGVLIHHNFPLDGEYVFKVKLLKSTVDLLFGGNAQNETLELALNGELVKIADR